MYNLLSSGSDGNESACKVEDLGLIPGSGKSPGERNGNPLQYFCLENTMDREAWWATVDGVAKSQKQLSKEALSYIHVTIICIYMYTMYICITIICI